MASNDMTIILNSVQLPKFSTLRKVNTRNEKEIVTMRGTLHTDFINIGRAWAIGWRLLSEDDYDTIRELYESQFDGETLLMNFPAESLTVYVKMTIPDIENIKFSGAYYENFDIVLKEIYAFS